MFTKEDILECFEYVDEAELKILEPLIEEAVFLKGKLEEVKDQPFIDIRGKTNGFYQIYKNLLPSYTNVTKMLVNSVRKVETSQADELLKRLEQF